MFCSNVVSGEIPLIPMNYSQVAIATSFNRSDVECCVRDALNSFSREVAANKGEVSFTFRGIGKIVVQQSNLKMRFFKAFVRNMDSTGIAVTSMQNRPDTADSVLSRAETPRESQAVSKSEHRPMQTIEEAAESVDDVASVACESCPELPPSDRVVESGGKSDLTSNRVVSRTAEEREAIFSDLRRSVSPSRLHTARPRTSASDLLSQSTPAMLSLAKSGTHPLDTLPDQVGVSFFVSCPFFSSLSLPFILTLLLFD